MEKIQREIIARRSEPVVDDMLKELSGGGSPFTIHFTQKEEYFVRLQDTVSIPSFPIHHDVSLPHPSREYSEAIGACVAEVAAKAPAIFGGLHYFFDKTEILKPCFYRLMKSADFLCLHLLRLDVSFRASECELTAAGSNDRTAAYRSRNLFIENSLIPLSSVSDSAEGERIFTIDKIIEQTWIGETGRGYRIQGIWIDQELTKFFTALFLPADARSYPYYPFFCMFKTMCLAPPSPAKEEAKKYLPLLHRTFRFMKPAAPFIEKAMAAESFSKEMPLLAKLREKVPVGWQDAWSGMKI